MRKVVTAVVGAGIALALTPSAGLAAGNAQSGPSVGNCISDIVYGNEPNSTTNPPGGPAEQEPGTKGGTIVPTQSPGPFVNNPADPDNPVRGRSVGQFMQDGINIPQLCRAAFGNG